MSGSHHHVGPTSSRTSPLGSSSGSPRPRPRPPARRPQHQKHASCVQTYSLSSMFNTYDQYGISRVASIIGCVIFERNIDVQNLASIPPERPGAEQSNRAPKVPEYSHRMSQHAQGCPQGYGIILVWVVGFPYSVELELCGRELHRNHGWDRDIIV